MNESESKGLTEEQKKAALQEVENREAIKMTERSKEIIDIIPPGGDDTTQQETLNRKRAEEKQ